MVTVCGNADASDRLLGWPGPLAGQPVYRGEGFSPACRSLPSNC